MATGATLRADILAPHLFALGGRGGEDALLAAQKPRFAPWLIEPMLRNRATYMKVAVAAALINIFALVSSLFTMTVYDRIVPNEGSASLIGLSIGLVFVIIFGLFRDLFLICCHQSASRVCC